VAFVYSKVNEPPEQPRHVVESQSLNEAQDQQQSGVGHLDLQQQDLVGPAKSTFGIIYNVMIYVTHVDSGSPAEEAGLKRGDLITRVGGMQVKGIQTLKAVQTLDPGTLVDVEYLRPNPNSETFTKFRGRVALAALRQ
jgi:serine protease Do